MLTTVNIKALSRDYFIYFSLCVFLIYMVTGSGYNPFFNANFIYNLEIIFSSIYLIFSIKEISHSLPDIKKYKSTLIILALWICSVIYSYFNSPIYTEKGTLAFLRLFQSFAHVGFFIVVWHYFKSTMINLVYLFYTIVFSTIIVAIYFFYHWINSLGYISFNSPPLNSHIRHTGYQVAAALSFFFIFLIRHCEKKSLSLIHILGFIFLWTFLFWLGGRGVVISIFITFLCLTFILRYKNIQYKKIAIIVVSSIILGLLLSELLSIFSWNGILQSIQRSVASESVNRLSSGRITLWLATIDSLRNNIWFGLGPQGYFLMENRTFGVQPHNVLMQFLIEWGVVGTLLFLLLLFKAAWFGFKQHILSKENYLSPSALAAGAVICTLSINALTDGTYYHPQPSVYLAIAFAIWVLPARIHTNENKADQKI